MSNDNYLKGSCKECGNHIEFPGSSAGTVVTCPHCGQWTELHAEPTPESPASKRKGLGLAVVLGCVVLAAAIGVLFVLRNRNRAATSAPLIPPSVTKVVAIPSNSPPAKPIVTGKREKSPDDLKVSPVQLEKSKVGSLVYAIGTVTNASEFQRFGVKIELELFNQNGKKLGVATDYKDIIEPNREWQFHALIPDSRAASAKVSSLKED